MWVKHANPDINIRGNRSSHFNFFYWCFPLFWIYRNHKENMIHSAYYLEDIVLSYYVKCLGRNYIDMCTNFWAMHSYRRHGHLYFWCSYSWYVHIIAVFPLLISKWYFAQFVCQFQDDAIMRTNQNVVISALSTTDNIPISYYIYNGCTELII